MMTFITFIVTLSCICYLLYYLYDTPKRSSAEDIIRELNKPPQTCKPLTEGSVKNAGVGQIPTEPKPDITPPPHKPVNKPRIVQLCVTPNDDIWQGQLLGLGDDGITYCCPRGEWVPYIPNIKEIKQDR